MANFYNLETSQPLDTMYISSSRKGRVVLKAPPKANTNVLSMRRPEVTVANGGGTARFESAVNSKGGEYLWSFTGLAPGASILALDGQNNKLAEIRVKALNDHPAYKEISKRFNKRGMKIDLDSHIDYVCYAADLIGEGISFRPKKAVAFKEAITDTRLFHYDDPSDPIGKVAAHFTRGDGYREVSTPSLHVAVDEVLSSVHIDGYAFMLEGPFGGAVVGADVGQHIFDDLLFRLPIPWLRRKGHTFLASVLQVLHPVLPNSTNRYSSIVGLRVAFGGKPTRDYRSGVPRLMFESTYDFGRGSKDRVKHEATLRLASGGDPDRKPDWVLSLKAQRTCIHCEDAEQSVGLYLTIGDR